MVLEFHLAGTGVLLMWYWQRTYMHKSGILIDVFLIFIKVHLRVSSYLFKHLSYHFLLLWWKKEDTTPTLEILVASEVQNKGCHELVVLLWEHVLLEVGESSGESHGVEHLIVRCSLFVAFSHIVICFKNVVLVTIQRICIAKGSM